MERELRQAKIQNSKEIKAANDKYEKLKIKVSEMLGKYETMNVSLVEKNNKLNKANKELQDKLDQMDMKYGEIECKYKQMKEVFEHQKMTIVDEHCRVESVMRSNSALVELNESIFKSSVKKSNKLKKEVDEYRRKSDVLMESIQMLTKQLQEYKQQKSKVKQKQSSDCIQTINEHDKNNHPQ